MSLVIKKSSIPKLLLIGCIVFRCFVTLPNTGYSKLVSLLSVVAGLLLVAPYVKIVYRRLSKTGIFWIMLLYIGAVMISAINHWDGLTLTHPINGAMMYVASLLVVVFGILVLFEKSDPSWVVKIFYRIMLLLCAVNDFFLIISPSLFNTTGAFYLVGNKFSVAYLHIQTLAFFLLNNDLRAKKDNLYSVKLVMLLIIGILITRIVDTSTGLVGMVLLMLFYYLPMILNTNSVIWFATLALSSMFVFIYDMVLSLGPVRIFITNVLGRSLTLTGRTLIYSKIPEVLSDRIVWGYGYGSSYEVWYGAIQMPNSQNGVIDCILEQGLVATGLLILLMLLLLSNGKNIACKEKHKAIYAVIFCFTILSAVEITTNLAFVFWFVLIYFMMASNRKSSVN